MRWKEAPPRGVRKDRIGRRPEGEDAAPDSDVKLPLYRARSNSLRRSHPYPVPNSNVKGRVA